MLTTINGFDCTKYITAVDDGSSPIEQFTQSINDQIPSAQFDVQDIGCKFSFDFGQEVIIWNENAPPEPNFNPNVQVPAVPAHNIVQLPNISGSSGGAWATTGALSIFSSFPGLFPVVTFSNTTYSGGNNYEHINAISPPGYVHAGQQYMFSVYASISTPLINAQADVGMLFLDGSGNIVGSRTTLSFSSTTGNAQQRVNVSATAPAGAAYVECYLGGTATVSGTNSGTINYGTPQLEPMYFNDPTTIWQVSYPTPDCNYYQVDCSQMPDGTVSRTVRFFSGYISDFKIDYDGPNRIWHITCAGPGAQLDNGMINAVYTGQTDAAILTSIVNTYFSGQLGIVAPNSSAASPLQTGITVDSQSYNDNSLRDVSNGLIDASGFVCFIDMYYTLRYQPSFYNVALFTLSDSPDNVTSFAFYAYERERDGTQVKRRIKIKGGNFVGTKTDVFSGNGGNKQFALTYIPDKITFCQVTSTNQKVGVFGRDTLGASYDALVNTQSQYLLFNTAPPNASNNVVVTYTYQAPIDTQTIMQGSGVPTIPSYAIPLFDSKVNDSNILSLTAATQRGIAEIAKYGSPIDTLTLTAQQFTPAGNAIYITSLLDGIVSTPYIVQQVTGKFIGGVNSQNQGQYEYDYTLGIWKPSIIDHLRNANKALNRSISVSGVTPPQNIDLVALELAGWSDSIKATPQPSYSAGVYGTGKYGQCSYGGATGLYGTTAKYGLSTIYG